MRFSFLAVFALLAGATAQAALPPGLQKLVGRYESDGYRFEVMPAGNTLALRTNAELTRYPKCDTRLGAVTGQYFNPRDPEIGEVYYQLDRGNCPNLDGRVTLHYNRALTGADIYLIDVVIHQDPPSPHQPPNSQIARWNLRKVSGR